MGQLKVCLANGSTGGSVFDQDGQLPSTFVDGGSKQYLAFELHESSVELTIHSDTEFGPISIGPMEILFYKFDCKIDIKKDCECGKSECDSCFSACHSCESQFVAGYQDKLVLTILKTPKRGCGDPESVVPSGGKAIFEQCGGGRKKPLPIEVDMVLVDGEMTVPIDQLIPNTNYRLIAEVLFQDPLADEIICCDMMLLHVNNFVDAK